MDECNERQAIVERYRNGRKNLAHIDDWEDPKLEIYHVTDRYGFIHDHFLPDKLTAHENKLRTQESNRSAKWTKMLDLWDKYYPDSEKLRSRVYKGIPDGLRVKVWPLLLEVNKVKQEQSGKYMQMLEWGLGNSPDVRQIDLDVNRTYRNNIMFRERYCIKQQMLFNVLVAYSVYNSEIGYCQGMSQIAALLLMYMDEEDAFWSLSVLMTDERHAMHGFFIPGFPKLLRFARHHDMITQKFLPKLAKLLKKYDIDSTLYTLKWFFQCFLDRVPFSLTLRLWDCFILEGEMILTAMSYTLLKLHKRNLLRKGMEQMIEFLQIELEKDFGYHDDEAITALRQSILELSRHRMLHPSDGPTLAELPSRPFGLLSVDNVSISNSLLGNDDQSIAGSIILRPIDSISIAQTSKTESEAGSVNGDDINDELKLQRSLSLYDNVDVNESINAAKRLSGIEGKFINSKIVLQSNNVTTISIESTESNLESTLARLSNSSLKSYQ